MELIVDPIWAAEHPCKAAKLMMARVYRRLRERYMVETGPASRVSGMSAARVRQLAQEGTITAEKRKVSKGRRVIWVWYVDVRDVQAYAGLSRAEKMRLRRGA